MQKSYENNMADQDVVVHSLRVLSEIKNPALSQLKRDLNTQQTSAQALAIKQEKFYKSLSDDGIISPMEKKIVQREMESIATSYTALYTQAVAEHYETAPFFQDYMATYAALRNYIYSTLHLFDDMDADTEVDRDEFNSYFSAYYYDENFAIVSMTVGVITDLGFKILESLEDEGEEGEVGIYRGMLYQYIDGEWKLINKELYYGKSAVLPPELEGRYFLCTDNVLLYDVLYANDDPLELNGEMLEVGGTYEKGIIYVYEDHHWQRKEPDEDYRYLVALGDYYSVKDKLPDIMKAEVESIARDAVGSTYYGPLTVPPVSPHENDFFLYAGETSGETPPRWVFASLYMYKNSEWVRLDEAIAQNQKYYMEALQDILSITASTSGYFSTVFCNAFFANQAAMNSLSTKVIYLNTGGALRSEETAYIQNEQGLLIDADGNIDANGDTHIGGNCIIDGNAEIRTSGLIQGDLNITGEANFSGRTRITGDALFSGDIISGPMELSSEAPLPRTVTYNQGESIPFMAMYGINGSYRGYTFDGFHINYDPGHMAAILTLYNGHTLLYTEYNNAGDPYHYYVVKDTFTYAYIIPSGSKTFKLKDLPTTPGEANVVYKDSNGFLKIS